MKNRSASKDRGLRLVPLPSQAMAYASSHIRLRSVHARRGNGEIEGRSLCHLDVHQLPMGC
eukprot:9931855-Alexandrium_andersonii.AAC.1